MMSLFSAYASNYCMARFKTALDLPLCLAKSGFEMGNRTVSTLTSIVYIREIMYYILSSDILSCQARMYHSEKKLVSKNLNSHQTCREHSDKDEREK